jgi:hypothetical protein
MKSALLAVLLALAGHADPPSSSSPSALPGLVAQHPTLRPAVLVGAWHGMYLSSGATGPSPLEVAFADGVRPSTIFGYFVVGDRVAPRLRRLGVLTTREVTFDLRDGRIITLWADAGGTRLAGSLARDGQQQSAIMLSRVRDPAPLAVVALPRASAHDLLTRPDAPRLDASPGSVMRR